LKFFEVECDGFLGRIVKGDERCVYYHQPETKKTSKDWRHTSSPKLKKIPHTTICGKGYADCLLG